MFLFLHALLVCVLLRIFVAVVVVIAVAAASAAVVAAIISAFPPMLRDWVIKRPGMSSRVCGTGHIQDPVPLIEKRRGLSPGGRFPPGFIHRGIVITGLIVCSRPEDGLRCRLGVKFPLKLKLHYCCCSCCLYCC